MDSEIAGRPEEYFLAEDPKKLPDWRFWEEGPFGLTSGTVDRESYLDAVYRMGSTSNGVFGAKLMWNNVPWSLAKFQEMPRFSSLERAQVFHTAFGLRESFVVRWPGEVSGCSAREMRHFRHGTAKVRHEAGDWVVDDFERYAAPSSRRLQASLR